MTGLESRDDTSGKRSSEGGHAPKRGEEEGVPSRQAEAEYHLQKDRGAALFAKATEKLHAKGK